MKLYEFQTEEEFMAWMKRKRFGKEYIKHVMKHEKAHFDCAKSKGYISIYVMEKNTGKWYPRVDVIDANSKDMIDICLAPEDPGINDLLLASLVRGAST